MERAGELELAALVEQLLDARTALGITLGEVAAEGDELRAQTRALGLQLRDRRDGCPLPREPSRFGVGLGDGTPGRRIRSLLCLGRVEELVRASQGGTSTGARGRRGLGGLRGRRRGLRSSALSGLLSTGLRTGLARGPRERPRRRLEGARGSRAVLDRRRRAGLDPHGRVRGRPDPAPVLAEGEARVRPRHQLHAIPEVEAIGERHRARGARGLRPHVQAITRDREDAGDAALGQVAAVDPGLDPARDGAAVERAGPLAGLDHLQHGARLELGHGGGVAIGEGARHSAVTGLDPLLGQARSGEAQPRECQVPGGGGQAARGAEVGRVHRFTPRSRTIASRRAGRAAGPRVPGGPAGSIPGDAQRRS